MQRQIKFRAWDKKRKKMGWVEALFCDYKNKTNEDDWICYSTDDMKIKERPCGDYREKQNVVLMQYTGLKDKNNKEIYEGDIIRAFDRTSYYICEVVYTDGAMFMLKWYNNKWGENKYSYFNLGCFEKEVIGTIYTTPELLKVGGKVEKN